MKFAVTIWDSRTNETSQHEVVIAKPEVAMMSDIRFIATLHAGVCAQTEEDPAGWIQTGEFAIQIDTGYPVSGASIWREHGNDKPSWSNNISTLNFVVTE